MLRIKRGVVKKEPVKFPKNKVWKDYIDARRMEVACGEAPYLVSRYDTVSGQEIPISEKNRSFGSKTSYCK